MLQRFTIVSLRAVGQVVQVLGDALVRARPTEAPDTEFWVVHSWGLWDGRVVETTGGLEGADYFG